VNNVSVKVRGPGHRGDPREVAHDLFRTDGPDRVGRFSEGLEQYPEQVRRIGRFSDGLEQYPEQVRRIGRFSDGLEQYPDQPPVLVGEDLPGSATSEAA
jgi:hypothetical protein